MEPLFKISIIVILIVSKTLCGSENSTEGEDTQSVECDSVGYQQLRTRLDALEATVQSLVSALGSKNDSKTNDQLIPDDPEVHLSNTAREAILNNSTAQLGNCFKSKIS